MVPDSSPKEHHSVACRGGAGGGHGLRAQALEGVECSGGGRICQTGGGGAHPEPRAQKAPVVQAYAAGGGGGVLKGGGAPM